MLIAYLVSQTGSGRVVLRLFTQFNVRIQLQFVYTLSAKIEGICCVAELEGLVSYLSTL